MHEGFETAQGARDYILGSNATLTLTSAKTGSHFTYKVKQGWDRQANKRDLTTPYFVYVLSGPDNTDDYTYIGMIKSDGQSCLLAGQKGRSDAPSFQAFSWMWEHLNRDSIPEQLTIQHAGSCCRCGWQLTDPNSIASGIGPECATYIGMIKKK